MLQQKVNTFKDGLVMDLSPMNQEDTSLSNSLNAAIITHNGDEYSLLNDMGNAKVEGVKLDKNFIPVGITSSKGVIYVASHNPNTGYDQVGAFPSPKAEYTSDILWTSDTIGKHIFEDATSDFPKLIVDHYDYKLIEGLKLRDGDSIKIRLSDDLLDFINERYVDVSFVVKSKGSESVITNDNLKQWLSQSATIYYSGKTVGEVYIRLTFKVNKQFTVQDKLEVKDGKLYITFTSSDLFTVDGSEPTREITLSFTDEANVDIYPVLLGKKSKVLDGTNKTQMYFDVQRLINERQLLTKYQYYWEDDLITIDWTYQSTEDNQPVSIKHILVPIDIADTAMDLTSLSLLGNEVDEELTDINGSHRLTTTLGRGIYVHVIQAGDVRAIRFIHASGMFNSYYGSSTYLDFNDIPKKDIFTDDWYFSKYPVKSLIINIENTLKRLNSDEIEQRQTVDPLNYYTNEQERGSLLTGDTFQATVTYNIVRDENYKVEADDYITDEDIKIETVRVNQLTDKPMYSRTDLGYLPKCGSEGTRFTRSVIGKVADDGDQLITKSIQLLLPVYNFSTNNEGLYGFKMFDSADKLECLTIGKRRAIAPAEIIIPSTNSGDYRSDNVEDYDYGGGMVTTKVTEALLEVVDKYLNEEQSCFSVVGGISSTYDHSSIGLRGNLDLLSPIVDYQYSMQGTEPDSHGNWLFGAIKDANEVWCPIPVISKVSKYIDRVGEKKTAYITPYLLNFYLSQIFTLQDVEQDVYVTGVSEPTVVYNIQDLSYADIVVTGFTMTALIDLVLKDLVNKFKSTYSRLTLHNYIPTVKANKKLLQYNYGALFNLDSNDCQNLVTRYTEVYSMLSNITVKYNKLPNISYDKIYTLDLSKLKQELPELTTENFYQYRKDTDTSAFTSDKKWLGYDGLTNAFFYSPELLPLIVKESDDNDLMISYLYKDKNQIVSYDLHAKLSDYFMTVHQASEDYGFSATEHNLIVLKPKNAEARWDWTHGNDATAMKLYYVPLGAMSCTGRPGERSIAGIVMGALTTAAERDLPGEVLYQSPMIYEEQKAAKESLQQ